MTEHLYPCRTRTNHLAICDCKENPITPTASEECREAFEKEFAHLNFERSDIHKDRYRYTAADFVWSGWKAAWNRRAPVAQAEGEVVATRVMQSAHALCPTDMPHTARMKWMADYFLSNYAPAPQAGSDPAMQVAAIVAPIADAGGTFGTPDWVIKVLAALPEYCWAEHSTPAPQGKGGQGEAIRFAPSDLHWRQAVYEFRKTVCARDGNVDWIERRAKELADGEG